MKKRWTAALLALVLAVSLLPAPAQAASSGGTAGDRLTGVEREVYDYMKTEIAKVAGGTRSSTSFKIPDQSSLSWPTSELGRTGSGVRAAVEAKMSEVISVRHVFDCLCADLAYELFWRSDRFTWGYTVSQSNGRAYVRNLIINIEVAESYRSGNATTANLTKIAGANKALANAQAIVEKYQDLSDMDKLAAYREEICRLVSYNSAALKYGVPYGDPWQMIYVFDGDDSTNVVCEGYAKAFKYLCDQSEFNSDVTCWIVSGVMDREHHMWNVVRMGDGKNYVVDVTNCDTGTIGADDKLFLTGASGSADGRTWTVSKSDLKTVYTYNEDQAGLYTDGYLPLNSTDYVPGSDLPKAETPAPVENGPFTDVAPEAYYAGAVAWAVEEKITKGTSNTTFSPGLPCTHGQILTFLWRAAGEPVSYEDAFLMLDSDAYYAGAVRWAAGLGMVGEDFDPEAGCSRAGAVWYIWNAFDGPDTQVGGFSDVPADSPYAHAVGWAVLEGVTKGTSDTTFSPDTICSRGEIVTFLHRAYQ